ncbi:hypothetical protein [Mesorhizobium loti]|uniref:TonB C-terminal domain-containing protein n=1 Tax=Mesorhizobium loti R88b TaxID=935548 RepID=A0A6M7WF41_RHILI|nr:hypothetical protein [Mesorhizobium loti]QKD00667.1 hypothetical protein EB235_03545 [Mesorhizobium loti R88b]
MSLWSYFFRRAAVTMRSAQKYILIGSASLIVSVMAPAGTPNPKFAVLFDGLIPSASAATVVNQSSKGGAEINQEVLDDLGSRIFNCWSYPSDAKNPVSIRMRLLPTGELDGKPTGITEGLASTKSDQVLLNSAVRAVSKCAPYADIVAASPGLAGNDVIITLKPESVSSSAQLAEDEKIDATGTKSSNADEGSTAQKVAAL